MKRRAFAQVAIVILLLCGCVKTASTEAAASSLKNRTPGNHGLSIAVGGLERRYVVHIPPGYDRNKLWPVVIMFHGGGGTARSAMRQTGFAEKADREGFLAVFPEGTAPDPSRPGRFLGNPQTWNDGSDRRIGAVERNIADVQFVSALIAAWLKLHECRTKSRVVYNKQGARGVAYDCSGGKDTVVLYTIDGHGHHWPGGKSALPERTVGRNTAKLKATLIIWDFFKTRSLPD